MSYETITKGCLFRLFLDHFDKLELTTLTGGFTLEDAMPAL